MACEYCGASSAAVQQQAAAAASSASATATADPWRCPARASATSGSGAAGGAADDRHKFVPIPTPTQPPAAPGLAPTPPAGGVLHVTPARVSYDPTTRMPVDSVRKIIAALKQDIDHVPDGAKHRERVRILCFLELLEDLAGFADHAHYSGSGGHIIEFQNYVVDDLRKHLVPGATSRQASREQCLATVAEVVPLPSPPTTPSPSPSVARSTQSSQQRAHGGGAGAQQRSGGTGSGGGSGGGRNRDRPQRTPSAANIAPSASRGASSATRPRR